MVSSKEEEVFWVFDLESKKKADCFNTLLTTINVVANKQILLMLGWIAGNIKKSENVEELPMDITKDFDWCFQLEQHLLRLENFS